MHSVSNFVHKNKNGFNKKLSNSKYVCIEKLN